MRKLFFALATMLFMTGLVIAADVTVLKYDPEKKEVVVKEGEKEVTYKFSEKVKVTLLAGKDGKETEGKFEDLERRLKNIKADDKRQMKMTIETKDKEITEVKFRGGRMKQN
mgnify:CR=1 FL=1